MNASLTSIILTSIKADTFLLPPICMPYIDTQATFSIFAFKRCSKNIVLFLFTCHSSIINVQFIPFTFYFTLSSHSYSIHLVPEHLIVPDVLWHHLISGILCFPLIQIFKLINPSYSSTLNIYYYSLWSTQHNPSLTIYLLRSNTLAFIPPFTSLLHACIRDSIHICTYKF